jgi:ribonucleotide reductase alpha subunit
MLDRYSFKDSAKTTLSEGDLVVLTVSPDPKFPARGIGTVLEINGDETAILLEEAYAAHGDEDGIIFAPVNALDKPLELFYEQIAHRVAKGIAAVEKTQEARDDAYTEFFEELSALNFIPGGRVIYGAGTGTDVTFFNCFVMPYPKDSREGIGHHRNEVMEIMSRGGGVGTNGSTLRPRNARARGVNGRSSGSVSWLNDIAQLTHLVEQGGSRRGAQMIMLADWHPDIFEFVIAKMQNPLILRKIIETTTDDEIRALAKEKLKFTPFAPQYKEDLETTWNWYEERGDEDEMARIDAILEDGGTFSVQNPDFLTGANISVAITKDFMQAVESDADYDLRFPDVENYDKGDMLAYNLYWHEVGDARKWERMGYAIKTYRTIKAKALWDLINLCATYSAEPGIFFLDNANEATNAAAYGQQVVATNPCITGDTLISTVEGKIAVRDLVEGDEDIDVYTMDDDQELTIRRATDFRKTGESQRILRITTARGTYVRVTELHPIFVQGKGWVDAKDIKVGDKLVELYEKMGNERYKVVKLSTESRYQKEHRFVAGHYSDISGMNVHHKDDDSLNNHRSNLEVLTHSEHSRLTNVGHTGYAEKCEDTGKFMPKESRKKRESLSLDKPLTYCEPRVVSIEEDGYEDVYNFEVDEFHNYIANNIVVHNCGEQPLAPYSVCNLAAINLANMVDKTTKKVDFEKLAKTARVGVHFGDNVIDSTPYFLEANKTQALGERRVGMGVMGLADLLIYCEEEYGSPSANALVDQIFETIAVGAYGSSIEQAKTKGSFPFLADNREAFIDSGYMSKMPEHIRQGVLDYGIRNSHLLTVAPTGTTGSMVGVATGLEPYFAFKYYRSGRLGNFMEVTAGIVQEYLDANPGASADDLPAWFISTMALAPEAHVDVQCIIQRWIDSSLSKTVNAPKGYTVEQVQGIYERLYAGGAKGGTVYVDGSRDAQVLTLSNSDDDDTVEVVPQQERTVVMVDTINELRSTSVSAVGTEIGDTCPVCKIGKVIDAGGCATCDNCASQLLCGL